MRVSLYPKFVFSLSVALAIAGFTLSQATNRAVSAIQHPPVAPVRPVVDDYHGTKIADPYRYMENLNDTEVQSWIKSENEYARSVLAAIPGREALLARIRELDQSVPQIWAGRLPDNLYLLLKRLPSDSTEKLYVRQGLQGEDRLLVDPEKIPLVPADQGKGTNVILGLRTSNNGKYVVVGIEPGGDELNGELHVIEMATGRETGDVIPQVGAEAWEPYWLPDDRSFVYGRLQKLPPGAPAAEVRQKFRSYRHVLGTKPDEDQPVFGYGVVPAIEVDPSLIASVHIPRASRWALGILNGSTTPNSAYYVEPVDDLAHGKVSWRKVADFPDGVTDVAVHDDDLYLLTYKGAPRYQVIRTDARQPDLGKASTVVPAGEAVVTAIHDAQDALYVEQLDGGLSRVLRASYGAHPEVRPVPLPFSGSAFVSADPRLPGALLYVTSWTRGWKIYAYDPASQRVTDTQLQPTGPYDEPANLESAEVNVQSYDGTLIPLSIAYAKKIKMDGSNPTLLEGYGGYGYSLTPYFDPTRLAWHEKGGIYATCHVRGGGEYGEEWHLAGKGATKPNTWKDFIACAQYLIKKGYTSSAHLAGEGVSAGGILIGRTFTSEPQLLAAAIDKVGVSDTLRFEQTQNGATNVPELGTVKTEEGFKALYEMSPYAHVKDGTAYPAILCETGMNDPRVDPWEMAKMAARLQAASASGKPVLLRVDYAGGHGMMGATREQENEQRADEWSFLLWQLGAPEFQPKKQ